MMRGKKQNKNVTLIYKIMKFKCLKKLVLPENKIKDNNLIVTCPTSPKKNLSSENKKNSVY